MSISNTISHVYYIYIYDAYCIYYRLRVKRNIIYIYIATMCTYGCTHTRWRARGRFMRCDLRRALVTGSINDAREAAGLPWRSPYTLVTRRPPSSTTLYIKIYAQLTQCVCVCVCVCMRVRKTETKTLSDRQSGKCYIKLTRCIMGD